MSRDVEELTRKELEKITQSDLVERIEALLVSPYAIERGWDYGTPGQTFQCWTVLEHPPSSTGIAYCERGFGPSDPWGLVFLKGEHMSIGMDSSWYSTLESAMRESMAWDGPDPEDWEAPYSQIDVAKEGDMRVRLVWIKKDRRGQELSTRE